MIFLACSRSVDIKLKLAADGLATAPKIASANIAKTVESVDLLRTRSCLLSIDPGDKLYPRIFLNREKAMRSRYFNFISKFAQIALLIMTLGLSACASGAKPGAMLPPNSPETTIAPNSVLRETVAIGQTSGGRETNPLWMSDVSSNDLAEALRLSLTARGMFTRNNERFHLEATLISLDRPLAGFDMKVTSKIRYRVTRVADNAVVFDREIAASFTAAMSSSFYGVERLRLANEGTIRENITQFLAALIATERDSPESFGRVPRPQSS